MSDSVQRQFLVTLTVDTADHNERDIEGIMEPSFITGALDLVLNKGESAYVQDVYGLLAQHETECGMRDELLGCCGGAPV